MMEKLSSLLVKESHLLQVPYLQPALFPVDLTCALCNTNSTHNPFLILVWTNCIIFHYHILQQYTAILFTVTLLILYNIMYRQVYSIYYFFYNVYFFYYFSLL